MNFPHSILRDGEPAAGGGGPATLLASGGSSIPVSPTPTPAPAAPAPTPKPFYEGLYDGTGKIDKTALDRLPDHMKGHKDWLSKYDTIEAALTGGATAHAMAVKKALAPLPEGSPPEVVAERKAHLDTLNNVPKDIKGYGITRPPELPEMFWNEEKAGKFGQVAQKHSISPAAVKELLDLQLATTREEIARGAQMEQEFFSKQDNAYNESVRKQGLDPEKAKDLASRGATTLGIDPKSPIFKNAEVRLACLRMANLVAEDRLITGADVGGGGAGELEQARDIATNPQNPLNKAFNDPMHPNHDMAKAKWNELYRIDGERKRKRGEAA